LVRGRVNQRLMFGDALACLEHPVAAQIIENCGIHVTELVARAKELKRARNDAIHSDGHRLDHAARVREMFLGVPSILATLYP